MTRVWAKYGLPPLVLPPLLFFLVRPDWYYIQNGLDPYFYTGYSQNLSHVMAVGGSEHYFVTRWTHYLPNAVFVRLLGPQAGYLCYRWLLAALVVGAVLYLGHRRWRFTDTLALAVLALANPMVVQPLLSDYVDSTSVVFGVVLLVVVATRPLARTTAAAVGTLGAAIVICNPLGFSVAASAVPAWAARVRAWRDRVRLAALAGLSAVVVAITGMVLIRWRYGVSGIYQATVEFMQDNAGFQDPLKSPRLWWLGYRLWIYIPLITLVLAWWLRRGWKVEFDNAERIILSACGVQYVFQIWYQFARHGGTLELPYYWSLGVPSFLLAGAVVARRAAATRPRTLPAVAATVLVAVVLFRADMPEVFGHWLTALGVVAALAIWLRRSTGVPAALAPTFIALALALQVGSPRGEPTLPEELRVDSGYPSVFNGDHSTGIAGFRAATWFSDEMKSLGPEVVRNAYFWMGEGSYHGHRLAAMFVMHESGRWLNAGWESEMSAKGLQLVQSGAVPILVIIAGHGQVDEMYASIDGLGYRPLLDVIAPDDPTTRVLVLDRR